MSNSEQLPQPVTEGERIMGIRCPIGSCVKSHASVKAEYRTIAGTRCLVWVYNAPCLERVHNRVVAKYSN